MVLRLFLTEKPVGELLVALRVYENGSLVFRRRTGEIGSGMIVGLGTDLVEVERLRLSLERFGARFLDRVFTEEERRYCAGKKRPEESLAARFAAKEAGAKALGAGMSRGIGWHDLEVRRAAGGAPELLLRGGALALAEAVGVQRAWVSLTHTERYASAVVIFEGTSPSEGTNSAQAGALGRG